jgi:hypothetical protein
MKDSQSVLKLAVKKATSMVLRKVARLGCLKAVMTVNKSVAQKAVSRVILKVA